MTGVQTCALPISGVTVSGVLWAVFQNNAGGAWDNAKKSFEAGVMINGEMTYKGSDAHKAAVTGDTVGDPFKDTSGPSMNILIKLTCLIGLVIAPILGNGHSSKAIASCCAQTEQCASMSKEECEEKGCTNATCDKINGAQKCDMSKCATMTKEECAAMCDEKGCSPEEKAKCLAMYGADGKFIGETINKEVSKQVSIEKTNVDGKVKATITTSTTENGVSKEAVQVFEGTDVEVSAQIEAFKRK